MSTARSPSLGQGHGDRPADGIEQHDGALGRDGAARAHGEDVEDDGAIGHVVGQWAGAGAGALHDDGVVRPGRAGGLARRRRLDGDAEAPALVGQPRHQGPARAGDGGHAPEGAVSFRQPHVMAPGGGHAGRLEAGRTAPDDQHRAAASGGRSIRSHS
jgi:hypothetical protein